MESTVTQLDLFQPDILANLTVMPGSDKARMMTARSGQRLSAYYKRSDPRWLVGENVAGHITMGLDDVLSDLGSIDYTAEPIVLPATAIGAIHRRDRVFILAYANQIGSERDSGETLRGKQTLQGFNDSRKAKEWAERSTVFEPKLHRATDGVPGGVDRLRNAALGNAVVPQQIYPIIAAIKQIDDMMNQ